MKTKRKRCPLDALMTLSWGVEFIEFPDQWARLGYELVDFQSLVRSGYLCRERVLAVPPVPLLGPLFRCRPGGTKPVFGPVAYASSRMAFREATELTILFASKKAAKTFGGHAPSLKHVGQLGHDLAVTSVLAALRLTRPQEAQRWVSESVFIRRHRRAMGRFIPDAAICAAAGGRLETAIDFAGPSYTPGRLLEIWGTSWRSGLSLEIWGEPEPKASWPCSLPTAS